MSTPSKNIYTKTTRKIQEILDVIRKHEYYHLHRHSVEFVAKECMLEELITKAEHDKFTRMLHRFTDHASLDAYLHSQVVCLVSNSRILATESHILTDWRNRKRTVRALVKYSEKCLARYLASKEKDHE